MPSSPARSGYALSHFYLVLRRFQSLLCCAVSSTVTLLPNFSRARPLDDNFPHKSRVCDLHLDVQVVCAVRRIESVEVGLRIADILLEEVPSSNDTDFHQSRVSRVESNITRHGHINPFDGRKRGHCRRSVGLDKASKAKFVLKNAVQQLVVFTSRSPSLCLHQHHRSQGPKFPAYYNCT